MFLAGPLFSVGEEIDNSDFFAVAKAIWIRRSDVFRGESNVFVEFCAASEYTEDCNSGCAPSAERDHPT